MQTQYHSTRGTEQTLGSKQAIIAGIAPDGGLYVSDQVGQVRLDLATVCANDYQANARLVLSTLLGDYSDQEIAACVEGAYGTQWDTRAITPLSPLGNDWLLELFHGPTCAFKDIALQMLPRLMGAARRGVGDGANIMILTATSGDTGKAALEGFANVEGTGVTVFYPDGKVSDVQRLQMVTQRGDNVAVCGIRGNFDDAQTEVKRIFADSELAARLRANGAVLSSANSINVGRLVPQVTYYFDAYAQLVRSGAVALGAEVEFCVPTGNFGDVLAGYYAKLLGLPVRRLIVASNANNVLTDFITTGTYDRRRPFHKTISPSMDILVSSNLERLLYYLSGNDCELVCSLMDDLAQTGAYTVPPALLEALQASFGCGCANDDATRATICTTWENNRVLIDPHTAVGKAVLDARENVGVPRICLSTASPYKFSSDVLAALGAHTEGLDGFACMSELERITGTVAPRRLTDVLSAPELHTDVCDRNKMDAFVESACARVFL